MNMFQFFSDIGRGTTDNEILLPLPTHCPLQLDAGLWSKAPVGARRKLWQVAVKAYLPPPRLSTLVNRVCEFIWNVDTLHIMLNVELQSAYRLCLRKSPVSSPEMFPDHFQSMSTSNSRMARCT